MLFTRHYLITILLPFTASVIAGSSNQGKADDCKKFMQGMGVHNRHVVVSSHVLSLKPKQAKQEYITFLNAMADRQYQSVQIISAIQLQDSKLKELQNRMAEAGRVLIQVRREQAKAIALLPGEPDKQTRRAALRPFGQAIRGAYKRSNDADREINKYCGGGS